MHGCFPGKIEAVQRGGFRAPAPSSAAGTPTEPAAPALNVGVFYYTFADAYITTVRTAIDEKLAAAGITYQNYDGANKQATQPDQINTAITNGANLLVVNIVETSSPDAPEAGHMQGEMIGDFLLANYDAVDLNGNGTISYVLPGRVLRGQQQHG